MVNKELADDDLEWYGFDPTSPTLLNDELSTIVVVEADEVPSDLLEELKSLLDPLQESNNYEIDIFVCCLNVLQNRSLSEQPFLSWNTACSHVL